MLFTACWLLLQQHCIIQTVPVLKLLITRSDACACLTHAYAFSKACMRACLCHSVSLWRKLGAGLGVIPKVSAMGLSIVLQLPWRRV